MLVFTILPQIQVTRGVLTEASTRAAHGQQTHEIGGGRA